MSVPILLFVLLVLTSTVAVVATVALFVQVLRRVHERWPKRLAMAIVLPWGAREAWSRGQRFLPAFWAISVATYAVLRIATAVSFA